MKSIGFILALIGTLLIIYYLVSIQSGPNVEIKEAHEVEIEEEKVDIRDLNRLKKALDEQSKSQEEKMRREIEKATGQ
jgi:beta-lactam-binding protein with PASTA domain